MKAVISGFNETDRGQEILEWVVSDEIQSFLEEFDKGRVSTCGHTRT